MPAPLSSPYTPTGARFIDHQDGTVSDAVTGLMWQQDPVDLNGDGLVTEADRMTWQPALQYAEALILCNDGAWTTNPAVTVEHGGVKYDDWRAPNVRELETLTDYGRWPPSYDPAFGNEGAVWYWSSTTHPGIKSAVWCISTGGGEIADNRKSSGGNLRVVRG